MEQEKIEKKEIIVLDEGINTEAVYGPGPDSVCCWASLIPYRW
jgi:hypothetical protein